MDLAALIADGTDEVQMWLDTSPPLARVAPEERYAVARPEPERLVGLLRAVGGAKLLSLGDTEAYHVDLVRSAQARRYFLGRAKAEGYAGPDTAASRTAGLFAALAAGSEVALAIAEDSSAEWLGADEYEDDFCYAHFLHRRLLGAQTEELEAVLERFEGALEGGESARLQLCRAALLNESKAFHAAFMDLVQERTEEVQDAIERHQLVTEVIAIDRVLFVEGLAWLRYAEDAGLAVVAEAPMCPQLSRRPGTAPEPTTGFPTL